MDDKTMIGLDYVRALHVEWGTNVLTPTCESRAMHVREPGHWRLDEQLRAIASQVPNRHQMFDWFGRRLITWGWQLRMRYGSRGR